MGAVITSKLTPFAPAMRKELARRGFSTGGLDFKNLMALYYNEIVSDKNISSNGLKPINAYEFTNNFVFRVTPSDNLNGDLTDIHNQLAFENVNTVTSDIINSFRIAMAKKRAAVSQGLNPSHVLTDTELLQARAGERVQNSLEQEVTDNKPVTFGQLRGLIIWILVIVLIFQFVK